MLEGRIQARRESLEMMEHKKQISEGFKTNTSIRWVIKKEIQMMSKMWIIKIQLENQNKGK